MTLLPIPEGVIATADYCNIYYTVPTNICYLISLLTEHSSYLRNGHRGRWRIILPHADLLGLDAAVHTKAAQGPVCQSGPIGAEELPTGDRGEEGGGAREGDEAEE